MNEPPEDFTQDASTAQWTSRFRAAPASWFTDVPPKRKWLITDSRRADNAGSFPLGKAGQLVAAGGVGKTMVLCDLALAVGSGGRWLDTFHVASAGPVVMFLGEEDLEECHRRLYNAAKRTGAPPSGSIHVVALAGTPCSFLEMGPMGPMESDFYSWARGIVSSVQPRLVIIDPMSRFAGLDAEKDNAIMTRFVQSCEAFTTPDCSALVAHHTPQASRGKGPMAEEARGRGVTAQEDGFRWVAGLSSSSDSGREVVQLFNRKSNYSRKFEPLLLQRDDYGALYPMPGGDAAEYEANAGKPKRDNPYPALLAAISGIVVDHPGISGTHLQSLLMSTCTIGEPKARSAIVFAVEEDVIYDVPVQRGKTTDHHYHVRDVG